MTTDVNTGLPELPEGYFWRVRIGSMHMTYVELRKKSWFGSLRVQRRRARYYDGDGEVLDPREEIITLAMSIMKEFNDPWTPFYGDYPPKKLESR